MPNIKEATITCQRRVIGSLPLAASLGLVAGWATIVTPVAAVDVFEISHLNMRGCANRADGSFRVFAIRGGDTALGIPCDLETEIEVYFRTAQDGKDGNDASSAGPQGPQGQTGPAGEQGPEGPQGEPGADYVYD